MATTDTAKPRVNCAVVVDARLASMGVWAGGRAVAEGGRGLADYLTRILGLLSTGYQQATVCIAPVVFASTSCSSTPMIRQGRLLEHTTTIIESLTALLESSRIKPKPFTDTTASPALLDGIAAGLELLRSTPSNEALLRHQHVIVISATDLPSLFNEDDEQYWDNSPALDGLGLSWQDLPRQLHARKVGLSVIASRMLPRLEALQRKVITEFGVENASPTAIPLHNAEHAVLMQTPVPSRSSTKRAGSPTTTRTTEDAKRPKLDVDNFERYNGMTKEQLQMELHQQRETTQKLFMALQQQVVAKVLTQEKAKQAAEVIRQRTTKIFQHVEGLLRGMSTDTTTKPIAPAPQPAQQQQQQQQRPSPQATSSQPQTGQPPAPIGPVFRGPITCQLPDPHGKVNLLAAFVPWKPNHDLGFAFPPKLEITTMIPVDMPALHQFATSQQLPVLRLLPIPSAMIDANAPNQGLGARNEAYFKQLASMLEQRNNGALIRLPQLPPQNGLLVIATPKGAGMVAVVCAKVAMPHEVIRMPAQQQRAPPPPPPPPAAVSMGNMGELEALQAMLAANSGKSGQMVGLGLGHPGLPPS